MATSHLYKIGPRHGVKKIGTAPSDCDIIAALGYHPDSEEQKRLVWGRGQDEQERRKDALETFLLLENL